MTTSTVAPPVITVEPVSWFVRDDTGQLVGSVNQHFPGEWVAISIPGATATALGTFPTQSAAVSAVVEALR